MRLTSFDQILSIFDRLMCHSHIWDHCKRVANLSYEVCNSLGLKRLDAIAVYQAAHLHDIGLLYYLKNDSVMESSEDHPEDGYRLFLRFSSDHRVAELIRHHHCYPKNYCDSRGYPVEVCQQLDKLDEPLQILQICNEFDRLDSYTNKNPIDSIIYDATLGRWDLTLTRKIISQW